MAFGIQTESNGGNFTPVVKINAKQGRVWRVDRSQTGDGWATEEVDITNDFQFVPDFENIEIGWMHFAAGMAPDLRMVKIGEALPAKPTENHKQGFRMKLKLGKTCGGDLREIAATAKSLTAPFDRLHDQYMSEKGAHVDQLPVVRMTGMKKVDMKTQHGTNTNFEPQFEIVKWVPRPAELDGGQPANEPAAATTTQMKTTSQAAPAPEPAADDGETF